MGGLPSLNLVSLFGVHRAGDRARYFVVTRYQ